MEMAIAKQATFKNINAAMHARHGRGIAHAADQKSYQRRGPEGAASTMLQHEGGPIKI